ncbi:hypothetical protein [Corynebacterium pseudodiphtheriticum]|uniref:hypothetical protein n=1 Tax=Corynebacterium pseudodiphtheriticum TaxID=37637 RepID=UPI0025420464|nr:hypothetical protein [Corynebacterium pseudodiphtheriticum]MDK4273745.1 hypothetical protein [Corynebacterium pseudodiphtheriticum]
MDTVDITLRAFQAIGSIATAIVAIIAAAIASNTLEQKRRSDDRNHWWQRMEWALDKFVSDDPLEQVMGASTFRALIDQRPDEDEHFAQTLRETVEDLHKENTEDKPPSLSDGDSEYNEGKALERGDSDDDHSNE